MNDKPQKPDIAKALLYIASSLNNLEGALASLATRVPEAETQEFLTRMRRAATEVDSLIDWVKTDLDSRGPKNG